jgi:cobalt transporter subunit CbtA
MESVRRLMLASIVSGAAAGLVLFLVQHVTVEPLIAKAEACEHAGADDSHAGHATEAAWQPAEGVARTAYTAIGTMLTGIAFGAILLGAASLAGVPFDVRRGVWLGAAGFLCFVLAPSAGLPPRPPGVPGADVAAAQTWWAMTATLTGVGLWLLFGGRRTLIRSAAGALALILPHVTGAPAAAASASAIVPADLVRQFAWTSIATRAPFWLLLGAVGGWLMQLPLRTAQDS